MKETLKENNTPELILSIIVTVVSGKESMRRCLSALSPQVNFSYSEIIVTFDKWSSDISELTSEYPDVYFHYIEDLGMAKSTNIAAYEHRLYDRRRAIGLQLAKGKIIGMTEDHAVPAKDWCEQILAAHEQPYDVIGGAIENGIDLPLNRAWYYCDFGRYGRPFQSRQVEYVSDVNVSYKRKALESVRDEWQEAYRETLLHWTLRKRGAGLFLDERLAVYQERPAMTLNEAFSERVAWGRVFAETRAAVSSFSYRLLFAAGTTVLPLLLLFRAVRNMKRQHQTLKQMTTTLPLVVLLLTGWSLGEFLGYLSGMPQIAEKEIANSKPTSISNQTV